MEGGQFKGTMGKALPPVLAVTRENLNPIRVFICICPNIVRGILVTM